jgi:hypothetical protein
MEMLSERLVDEPVWGIGKPMVTEVDPSDAGTLIRTSPTASVAPEISLNTLTVWSPLKGSHKMDWGSE